MVPTTPTNVGAIADVDHGAHVSWTASDNRGSPLVGYSITSSQLTGTLATAGPSATSAVVTGLTPGSMYNFQVTATNGIGTSQASFPSNNITAATQPNAPTGVAAVANVDHGVTVSWAAPATTGFSTLTKYTVTASPGGATVTTPNGNTLSAQVTGLTPGTPYTFTVFASNVIGDGPSSSASTPVTVLARLPAPTGLVACGADGAHIAVSFSAIAGASSYDVFYAASAPATSGTKTNISATSTTLTPPMAGTWYIAVAAVNPVGEGVASTDVKQILDGAVHDTLFVTGTGVVRMFDCFSQLGPSPPPSRMLTAGGSASGATAAPLAVDDVNAVIWITGTAGVYGWVNAKTLSGTVAPDYTFGPMLFSNSVFSDPTAIALDTIHHKVYVSNMLTDEVTPLAIYRFSYTSPADLNTDVFSDVTLVTSGDFVSELDVNPTNGDLYAATYGGNRGVLVFPAAHTATNGTTPSRTYAVVESAAYGVAYMAANGGTLYTTEEGSTGTLLWLTGLDGLASGTYPATGSLGLYSGATSNPGGVIAAGGALVIAPMSTTQVGAWSTANLAGSPLQTATVPDKGAVGIVYVP
jgi:hypothetical protein